MIKSHTRAAHLKINLKKSRTELKMGKMKKKDFIYRTYFSTYQL